MQPTTARPRPVRPNPMRRALAALALGACALGLVPQPARAAAFPERPIKMIVPFGPGTTTDTVSRMLADAMSKSLGQPVIIENRAGAGGSIGTELVARAPADGYTLVMGTVGTHAINKALYPKLGYDPLRDFKPVALVGYTPTLLVVGAGSPVRSLQDLAAAAAKPGGISFASAGTGTSGHLAGELLKSRLGGTMVHIPYKEGSQALTDVMSGQTQFMFYHPLAVLPHIKSGKMRALGTSVMRRSASAPDVPTIAEQLGGEFDLQAWFMLYAPAATPAPVLQTLRDSAAAALSSPDIVAKLEAQGLEKSDVTMSGIDKFGQDELDKWSNLIRQSGAQAN
ncbi:Bug family tripartite tricarboxylate transporter substrate binding protein [Achromobacter pulmonis]|nr:tripartite tricarboxylate transporter substrate binding protein [Achromobacter pulmonis]